MRPLPLLLALAACTDAGAPGNDTRPPTAGNMANAATTPPAALSPLTPRDIEGAKLTGELGCGFSADPGQALLLIAMGDVASKAPAQGIVRTAGDTARVTAPGGFDGMVKGVRFTGEGFTATIAITGPAAKGSSESPLEPATLSLATADGARASYQGKWTCGP